MVVIIIIITITSYDIIKYRVLLLYYYCGPASKTIFIIMLNSMIILCRWWLNLDETPVKWQIIIFVLSYNNNTFYPHCRCSDPQNVRTAYGLKKKPVRWTRMCVYMNTNWDLNLTIIQVYSKQLRIAVFNKKKKNKIKKKK
jgi:hypothetical protein